MSCIADDIRNALWDICCLTRSIEKGKDLAYEKLFENPASTFVAGPDDIHAGLAGVTPFGIVAAVRGTDMDSSLLDAINDLLCFKTAEFNKMGRVHEGFKLAYQALCDNGMLKRINELIEENPSKRLYLTGHSKGGAVATLLATFFSADAKKTNVVTFASPRVGDASFRANYHYEHWRYESFMDLVPHLPPTGQEYQLLKTTGCLINLLCGNLSSVSLLDYMPVGQPVNFYVQREECRAYGDAVPHEQHNAEGETLTSLYTIEWMALNRLFHGKSQADVSNFDLIGLLDLMNDIHNRDYDEMISGRNTVFY